MALTSLFRRAEFVTSVRELHALPPEGQGEIAFAGRSNSGKSSALNTLADHRRLAFVSKTPGRTQLINFFSLGDNRYLVDLPGYGYAKVPDAIRAPWGRTLGEYLRTRQSLLGLAVTMDIRHPLTEFDLELLGWFRPTGRPVHILLTKADKLSRTEAMQILARIRKELALLAGNYSVQLFSSLKKSGVEEAERVFAGWFGITLEAAPAKPVDNAAKKSDRDVRNRARRDSRNKKSPGKGDYKPGDKMP